MAMKDRMHTGALYLPGDDEIMDRQRLCLDRLYEFNHTRPSETDKRRVRRYQRHSRQCSGGGQPLPRAAPHQ